MQACEICRADHASCLVAGDGVAAIGVSMGRHRVAALARAACEALVTTLYAAVSVGLAAQANRATVDLAAWQASELLKFTGAFADAVLAVAVFAALVAEAARTRAAAAAERDRRGDAT